MTLSAPSFLAAASRPAMPPRASAEVAVFASAAPPDAEAEPPEPLSVGGEHATQGRGDEPGGGEDSRAPAEVVGHA